MIIENDQDRDVVDRVQLAQAQGETPVREVFPSLSFVATVFRGLNRSAEIAAAVFGGFPDPLQLVAEVLYFPLPVVGGAEVRGELG